MELKKDPLWRDRALRARGWERAGGEGGRVSKRELQLRRIQYTHFQCIYLSLKTDLYILDGNSRCLCHNVYKHEGS